MYNVFRDFKSLTSFSLSKVITDRQVVGLLVNQTNSPTNSQRDRKSDRHSDDRNSGTCIQVHISQTDSQLMIHAYRQKFRFKTFRC